jgi:hypothetical protein
LVVPSLVIEVLSNGFAVRSCELAGAGSFFIEQRRARRWYFFKATRGLGAE